MDEHGDLGLALAPLVEALERLGVTWYVGGSVASTIHGEFRATNDVDIVTDLREEHAPAIQAALNQGHYVSEAAIVDACRREGSFNVIHFATGLKVDVFVEPGTEYAMEARARRVRAPSEDADSTDVLWIASPEDTILAKLRWYRMGGEVSERQLRDVRGVLRVTGDRIDFDYLERWAATLGVSDLLERVRITS